MRESLNLALFSGVNAASECIQSRLEKLHWEAIGFSYVCNCEATVLNLLYSAIASGSALIAPKSSCVKKTPSNVVARLNPTYACPSEKILLFSARVMDGKERPCTLWIVRANALRMGNCHRRYSAP